MSDFVMWSIIAIVSLLIMFGVNACQDKRCQVMCAPDCSKVQFQTRSCWCKTNGKWEIKEI